MEHPNYKADIGTFIRACTNGTNDNGRVLIVGETPAVLVSLPGLGIAQLPMVILGKVVDKVFFDHGINLPMLERLYDAIAAPKAVYRSDTTLASAVVVTFETRPVDKPVVVAIHLGKVIGRTAYNVIASVYAKDNMDIEDQWQKRGLLLWEKEVEPEGEENAQK
jgi:hypothetical protein